MTPDSCGAAASLPCVGSEVPSEQVAPREKKEGTRLPHCPSFVERRVKYRQNQSHIRVLIYNQLRTWNSFAFEKCICNFHGFFRHIMAHIYYCIIYIYICIYIYIIFELTLIVGSAGLLDPPFHRSVGLKAIE